MFCNPGHNVPYPQRPLPSHHDGIEGIKGYIRGSVKDMQSLLKDPENNIPLPEDQFTKVEDERVISRCNFRKVCRGKREESESAEDKEDIPF